MTAQSKAGKNIQQFFVILALLAGLVNFILQDWCGLAITILASAAILAIYRLCKWFGGRWDRKAAALFKGLIQSDFLDWQQNLIEFLYPDLEIVSLYGKKYPAAIFRSESPLHYPFSGLVELKSLDLPEVQFDRKQTQYLKILRGFLRSPKKSDSPVIDIACPQSSINAI
ncbi:MAG: hypothetical protein ACERKX_14145 [Anaerolineales bacterium]